MKFLKARDLTSLGPFCYLRRKSNVGGYVSAPSAGELYTSCMQTAGDLVEGINTIPTTISTEAAELRAQINRQSAQAVLALVQSAVTIHAASKTAKTVNGRKR